LNWRYIKLKRSGKGNPGSFYKKNMKNMKTPAPVLRIIDPVR
jgi:hypothetical protein